MSPYAVGIWHEIIQDHHWNPTKASFKEIKDRMKTHPEGFFFALDRTIASLEERQLLVHKLYPNIVSKPRRKPKSVKCKHCKGTGVRQ